MNMSTQNFVARLYVLKDTAISLQHKGNIIGLCRQIDALIADCEAMGNEYAELTKVRLHKRQMLGIESHINMLTEIKVNKPSGLGYFVRNLIKQLHLA